MTTVTWACIKSLLRCVSVSIKIPTAQRRAGREGRHERHGEAACTGRRSSRCERRFFFFSSALALGTCTFAARRHRQLAAPWFTVRHLTHISYMESDGEYTDGTRVRSV